MAQVFISYSSSNTQKAECFLKRLESAEISCWFAQRDIRPGADYAVEIPKAIMECEWFILLLSDAAQNSPYVRLELDQAVKLRKRIIPVLLEQVMQNQQTNFFLNIKQAVDGTKDLNAAADKVIDEIGYQTPQIRPAYQASQQLVRPSGTDHICCPYCGCTVLKRYSDDTESYLYPTRATEKLAPSVRWVLKNVRPINTLVSICSIFVGIFLIGAAANTSGGISLYLVMVAILFAVRAVYGVMTDGLDILDALVTAIGYSGLKYQPLKCAVCERIFAVLIPEKELLEDRVEKLLESDSQH